MPGHHTLAVAVHNQTLTGRSKSQPIQLGLQQNLVARQPLKQSLQLEHQFTRTVAGPLALARPRAIAQANHMPMQARKLQRRGAHGRIQPGFPLASAQVTRAHITRLDVEGLHTLPNHPALAHTQAAQAAHMPPVHQHRRLRDRAHQGGHSRLGGQQMGQRPLACGQQLVRQLGIVFEHGQHIDLGLALAQPIDPAAHPKAFGEGAAVGQMPLHQHRHKTPRQGTQTQTLGQVGRRVQAQPQRLPALLRHFVNRPLPLHQHLAATEHGIANGVCTVGGRGARHADQQGFHEMERSVDAVELGKKWGKAHPGCGASQGVLGG